MTLQRRIADLEALAPAECRTCAEEPPITLREPGDPPPAPCPECGRAPFEFTIRIDSMERDHERP